MLLLYKLVYIIKNQQIKKEEKDYKIFLDQKIKLIYLKLKKYQMMNKLMNGLLEVKKNLKHLMNKIDKDINQKN